MWKKPAKDYTTEESKLNGRIDSGNCQGNMNLREFMKEFKKFVGRD